MKGRRTVLGIVTITTAVLFGGCTSGGGPARPGSSAAGAGGTGSGGSGGSGGVVGGSGSAGSAAGASMAGGGGSTPPGDAGTGQPPPVDAASSAPDAPSMADASTEPGTTPGSGACGNLFCEDFEEGMIDSSRWISQMGGAGTLTVQQDIVHGGKYAYHVHGTGASGDFAMIIAKDAPTALRGSGPLFGRAYVYANTNVGSHIELGFAGSTRDPMTTPTITKGMNFNYMEFAEFSNSWQLGFDLFDPAPDVAKGFVEEASYPPARDKYPAGTWNCIEWEFGDDPDLMMLWVDGKQIDQFDVQHIDYTSVARTAGSVLNGKSSGVIGGYTFFGFGFHSYGSSTTVDRYFDDIALDTKRVGCLPAAASGG